MTDPTIGKFYRAKNSDTFLGIVGRAYGVRSGPKRLRLAQLVNAHPFNWRLWRTPRNDFERRHFPSGIVKLKRDFPCTDADYDNDPSLPLEDGDCRPLVFIAHETDIWFLPPKEIVQRRTLLCWAASLTSLSQARSLTHEFADISSCKDTVETVTIGGPSTESIVDSGGGLKVFPSIDHVDPSDPMNNRARGESTVLRLAALMGLDVAFFVGNTRPGPVQSDREDPILEVRDVAHFLREAGGPIMILTLPRRGAGHATVVFGVSEEMGIYFEMDPMTLSTNGEAFGPKRTRILRAENELRRSTGADAREIYVLF